MQTSSPPPKDVHALSRFLRIVFLVMVLSVIFYGGVMAEVAPQLESRPLGSVKTSLTVLAALSGLVALYVRFNKIGALLSPDVPTDAPARLAKLRQYYLVCRLLLEKKKINISLLPEFQNPDRDMLPSLKML